MSVFPKFFLAFMSSDFSQFAFSSAGHLTLLWHGIKDGSCRHKCDYAVMKKKGQYDNI
jgi:hypothetical protein